MRCLLLGLSLLFAPLAGAQGEVDPAGLERIKAAIARVEAELAETRSERSSVFEELQNSEKAVLDVQQQLDSVAADIAAERSRGVELAAQQQALEASRVAQQARIASHMKNAWIAGNEEYLKLLLNQQDPRHTARMMRYYRYFNAARAAKIGAYNQTLAELTQVAADLAASTARLEVRQQDLAVQQASLADSLQQRQQVLAALDMLLESRGEELQRLESQKIEIELLLEELRESIASIALGADQEPISTRKGKLPWPLEGKVVNGFGARHALGDLTWEGITIAGSAGADIRAVHHGRVVFADWFSTSGLLLIIDHGDGYMSLYAHNQELYKAVGDWVAGGETVAAAGNTGGQRDFGLYFEMRKNGKAENPVNWLVTRR